ncbi:major facilitator superfamily domain-containing protein 4A-like [Macrobrachium rosenbergii]|uniref:major facilitator superfamily domain-containing protein 4A-like n=1 Tax=Macrobrachium rosenbergii TaxID=79674 RepID=UPI0034D5085E
MMTPEGHKADQNGTATNVGKAEGHETETNGDAGGAGVLGHAKELCVNKMGHTMVPRMEGGAAKFRDLFWQHRLPTITYCAVFWSFGMCVAFLGPTLLELSCRISSVFSAMSWISFSQSLFTLIGSACGGLLIQRLGNHVVLLISTSMLSITLATIPFCSVLGWLAVVLATMGFFMGTIDTVANISMIQLYGVNVAPFLQALHFFYGLGAFLSPMIAEPFLQNKACNDSDSSAEKYHKIHLNMPGNITQPLHQPNDTQSDSEIQYAFWILSGFQVPVILLLAVLLVREMMGIDNTGPDPPEAPAPEGNKEQYEMHLTGGVTVKVKDDEDRPPVTREQVIMVATLTAAMLFLYDGLQSGYGLYVFSYAVKSIAGMSMNEAAYLNACFWGTFAFGRLLSIGIATKLAPSSMLLCNIGGCLVAMVLMLCFSHNHSVLYVGTCIFGTFLSSVYPTAVTLAETYIHVTSFLTSILVATAASGEMLIPVIIGHEFAAFGPASLLVSGVIMTVLSFVLYIALYLVAQTIVRQSSEQGIFNRFQVILLRKKADETEDSGLMKHHVKYYSRMKRDLSESSVGDEAAGSDPAGETNKPSSPTQL